MAVKILFILFFLGTSVCRALDPPEPTITQIEFTFIATNLPPDSAGARPKAMYLAGNKYARIEQPADSVSDLKNLIVVNDRDIWVVDGRTKSAQHSVNRDTDSEVHNPILGPDCPTELFALEYGHELAFFEQNAARSHRSKNVDAEKCETLELNTSGYFVAMSVDMAKRKPLELKVKKDGVSLFQIRYLKYENNLPFDKRLFNPPSDVKISEEDVE